MLPNSPICGIGVLEEHHGHSYFGNDSLEHRNSVCFCVLTVCCSNPPFSGSACPKNITNTTSEQSATSLTTVGKVASFLVIDAHVQSLDGLRKYPTHLMNSKGHKLIPSEFASLATTR